MEPSIFRRPRDGLRLAKIWNATLRRAYAEAVANYGTPAAVIAVSDTLPLLAFPETHAVKRIAVIQAYENFDSFFMAVASSIVWPG